VFIEDAGGILTARHVRTFDADRQEPGIQADWLPVRRPLRIGVLAGASCPEIVIGQVMEKLAGFLA
jgi:4-hydroxy-3-methylbut-2-enyl diphosphate reductase IspH